MDRTILSTTLNTTDLPQGRENDPAKRLVEQAEFLSSDPKARADVLIPSLYNEIFRRYDFLPNDFIDLFQQEEIADSLAQHFINAQLDKAGSVNPDITSSDVPETAKDKLREFLNTYPQNTTLNDFLEKSFLSSEQKYGRAQMAVLLGDKFKKTLQLKLEAYAEQQALVIFRAAYDEAVQKTETKDRKKRDPGALERFIGFKMLSQAITLDSHGFPIVNKSSLQFVIEFLDTKDFSLDEVFFLIVIKWLNELKSQKRVSEIQEGTATSVETAIPSSKRKFKKQSLYNHDFDYRKFFLDHIAPYIRDVRRKRLNGNIKLRHVVEAHFIGLQKTPVTLHSDLLRPLAVFVEGDENQQHEDVRHLFNLLPGESDDSLQRHLQTTEQLLGGFLKLDDSPHFIAEIMAVKDLKTLARWVLKPQSFLLSIAHDRARRLIEEYKNTDILVVIQFEALQYLRYLLTYRKSILFPEVQNRNLYRDNVEEYYREDLNMRDIEKVTLPATVVEIYDNASSGSDSPNYALAIDPNAYVHDDDEKHKLASAPHKQAFPKEEKNFFFATVDVPIMGKGVKTIRIWIYAGKNWEQWHVKSNAAIVENFVREKNKHPDFTDLIRTTWGPCNPNDYEILTEYFETNAMSDGGKKYRELGNGDGASPEQSIGSYANHRRTMLSAYIQRNPQDRRVKDLYTQALALESTAEQIVEPSTKEAILAIINTMYQTINTIINPMDPVRMNFEIHIVQRLADFFIFTLSDHTETSHPRYQRRRIRELTDTTLYPHLIYGDPKAELKNLKFSRPKAA